MVQKIFSRQKTVLFVGTKILYQIVLYGVLQVSVVRPLFYYINLLADLELVGKLKRILK